MSITDKRMLAIAMGIAMMGESTFGIHGPRPVSVGPPPHEYTEEEGRDEARRIAARRKVKRRRKR